MANDVPDNSDRRGDYGQSGGHTLDHLEAAFAAFPIAIRERGKRAIAALKQLSLGLLGPEMRLLGHGVEQLVWSANREPGLAGYRIVWRDTTASVWQGSTYVGNVTQATVKGKSKDNYFFGVQAVDNDGNASVATYPVPSR